jgi:hypothetical protein
MQIHIPIPNVFNISKVVVPFGDILAASKNHTCRASAWHCRKVLMAMPKETHMSIQIGFSAQTKCSQTQERSTRTITMCAWSQKQMVTTMGFQAPLGDRSNNYNIQK